MLGDALPNLFARRFDPAQWKDRPVTVQAKGRLPKGSLADAVQIDPLCCRLQAI